MGKVFSNHEVTADEVSMDIKYFVFFCGYYSPKSVISVLPKDVFRDLFCFQFNEWQFVTPNNMQIVKHTRAIKSGGGTAWNASSICSAPNQKEYTVRLNLPSMQRDVAQSSCVMVGLSTLKDVDHINNSVWSYKRGYYIMIWKYTITYFSKDVEEGRIKYCPSPKKDSAITIKYEESKKEVHFYLDGEILENNPFKNVVFEDDYYLAGLFCVEKDSVTIDNSKPALRERKRKTKKRYPLSKLYLILYMGHSDSDCILWTLPKQFFIELAKIRFLDWEFVTSNNVLVDETRKIATKVNGKNNWNASCIASEPNLFEYNVKLGLPDLQRDVAVSSCIMIGLSTKKDVDYRYNKNFSYKRGYYIMVWRYYISYYSKNHEGTKIINCPEPKSDSIITIKYIKEKKEIHFYMDGELLANNPFVNVDWGKEDYYLSGLLCVEKDSLTLL